MIFNPLYILDLLLKAAWITCSRPGLQQALQRRENVTCLSCSMPGITLQVIIGLIGLQPQTQNPAISANSHFVKTLFTSHDLPFPQTSSTK